MVRSVKGPRTYVSPLRQEQAAATRRAVMHAARRLFETDGYAATSMPAIAAEAGVAVKTLYLAFGSKPDLLRTVWENRLAGDEAATPVRDRAWYREIGDDDDPRTKLRLLARQSGGVKQRTGLLLIVIRDAASTDPELRPLWQEIEAKLHDVSTGIVEQIARAGALRPDVEPRAAADTIWALNHPSMWHLLVIQRGWSDDAYQQWLEQSFFAQLMAV
jgi:AcrR family transcriptional regulator